MSEPGAGMPRSASAASVEAEVPVADVPAVDWDAAAEQPWGPGRVGPAGQAERLRSNVEALRVLRRVQDEQRPATRDEQAALARFTSWGALPDVFDTQKTSMDGARDQLNQLLSSSEFREARATITNAHFTDPRIATAMWKALQGLGFDGGHVLEPGSGTGGFIGLAPEGTKMVGVELDGVSADVAKLLYPTQVIRNESFADTYLPAGGFDAAIGNVPFAKVVLHDRLHNPHKHSIHNHFIIKSLDLTRPGGIVAVLTSRYTMDAADNKARREMADRADLIGAIRLPEGAHKELAGTEALSDLLIFRVKDDASKTRSKVALDGAGLEWIHTVPVELPDRNGELHQLQMNAWWDLHDDLVLGTHAAESGPFGMNLTVYPNEPLDAALDRALTKVVASAVIAGQGFSTEEPADRILRNRNVEKVAAATPRTAITAGDESRFEGWLAMDGNEFTVVEHGVPKQLTVPAANARPLRQLIELRTTQLTLLKAEAATAQDASGLEPLNIVRLRATLNEQYDAFVKRYGPINQIKLSVSKRLDKHGQPIVTRNKPNWIKLFDQDPFAGAVRGLEVYDEESNTAAKAAVFTRRVVQQPAVATSADSPHDALAITLDQRGHVDLEYVADLLDTDTLGARKQLEGLVFDDPASGRVVPRAEYLSGNVRKALAVAAEAALENPALQGNVDALRQVVPRDLGPDEIKVQLGAIWVPASDIHGFMQDILNYQFGKVAHLGGSNWVVEGWPNYMAAATQTWGTERMPAPEIIEKLLTQKAITVYDYVEYEPGKKRPVFNPVETAAAQEKAEALQDKFADWLWSDGDRAKRLVTEYNERFNSIALRDYSADGARLSLPGLAASFTPHPHQRTAVARVLSEPSVGLYHGVGAGKTAAMAISAVELRRLGLVNKPAMVVPNHMLEQVTREFLQLYPQAKVLSASSKDFEGDGRARFIGKAAMGDWDAVILTHNAFVRIPVDKATEVDYIQREVDTVRAQMERGREAGVSRSIKRMENTLKSLEERLKAKMDGPRDRGLTFEQSGIDFLIVDELHEFKNLAIQSNIKDAAKDGSQKASNLDMKIRWLRDQTPDGLGKVMIGATATPIANSISEAYTMQRYLRPDLLEDAGITDFDSWAGTFGSLVTDMEMTTDGGFKLKTRFARFDNLPELLRMWHVSADVKTSASLNLPIPALAERDGDGKRVAEVVTVEKSPEMAQFMEDLSRRADGLRNGGGKREKGDDNMLVVATDGRKAAMDLRIGRSAHSRLTAPASTPSKVDVVADRIYAIWARHQTNVYRQFVGTLDEREHARRGGFQLVFADLSVPGSGPAKPWNFYEELREQLTLRGMDPTRVRFVQDANNDDKKAKLFEACREGQVDVLVGSTTGMGVGTNVQTRAVALHHADAPWRPCDVEQREGRILRQGNQNPEVEVLRYVTEGSFDSFMWQGLARKQAFIEQVMNGSMDVRSAEDIDSSQSFSFAEVKAIASGNPLIMERAKAEQEYAKLQRLETAFDRNQTHRRATIRDSDYKEAVLASQIPHVERLIAERIDTSGEKFIGSFRGQRFTERTHLAEALGEAIKPAWERYAVTKAMRNHTEVGEVTIGKTTFQIKVGSDMDQGYVDFALNGVQRSISAGISDGLKGSVGMVIRLENAVSGLEARLSDLSHDLDRARSERAEAQAGLDGGFPRSGELKDAKKELERITELLAEQDKAREQQRSAAGEDLPPEPQFQASTNPETGTAGTPTDGSHGFVR